MHFGPESVTSVIGHMARKATINILNLEVPHDQAVFFKFIKCNEKDTFAEKAV